MSNSLLRHKTLLTFNQLPNQRLVPLYRVDLNGDLSNYSYRHKIVAKRGAAFTIMVCTHIRKFTLRGLTDPC